MIPLFPLQTVLFPDGYLPLQIFEARYIDMVTYCTKNNSDFGVITFDLNTSKSDQDSSDKIRLAEVGTLATIVDFDQLPNGLLGLKTHGSKKFRVVSQKRDENNLLWGEVDTLADEPFNEVPAHYQYMVDILRSLNGHPDVAAMGLNIDYEDARSIGWRISELLPFSLKDKQFLLTETDPIKRLDQLNELLQQLQESHSE